MLFSNLTDHLAEIYGIERAVDMIIEAGYPAADVSMFQLGYYPFTEDYLEVTERIKAKADKAGLSFIQAHAPFGGSKERVLNQLVPHYPRCFEVCEMLGIPAIVVHPIHFGRYNADFEERFNFNLEFYRSLVPLSEKHGVKIAIENMWTRHPVSNIICDAICADPAELCRMYDELNDPKHFTICLDLGHVALCQREPEDVIRFIGRERLGALHVHDVDYISDLHTLPGCGKINWDNVCRALGEIDYKGVFNMEADSFLRGFMPDHYPTVAKFMADTARNLATLVDSYRPQED